MNAASPADSTPYPAGQPIIAYRCWCVDTDEDGRFKLVSIAMGSVWDSNPESELLQRYEVPRWDGTLP